MGQPSVRAMLGRLPYAELVQWMAYADFMHDEWALTTNEGKDGNLVDVW